MMEGFEKKITPIGPIPKLWNKTTLKEVSEFITKGATPTTYGFEWVDNGVPFLRSECVSETGFNEKGLAHISEEANDALERSKVKSNDLLISITGNVGRVAVFPAYLGEGNINQHIARVRVLEQEICDRKYIYYQLSRNAYRKYYDGIITGAAYPQLSLKQIRDTPVFFPKIETQRKIASILSAYDDLIENNLKRIKLLEEKAQLTYEEWFVRMKFPGHETTPINKETGLPEGWELVKVGALLAKLKSTKKIKSSEILESGSTPVIDQSRDFIKGYTNEPDALIDIDEPIIVFGDHTRILKFIDFNFARGADGTQLVLSKDPRMPQHLFYQILMGIDLSDYHYARHFKYLKDTEINICDEITANHYEDFAAPLFKAIKQMRDQNKLLKEARDILLPRLMTGMIDVEHMNIETLQPTTA